MLSRLICSFLLTAFAAFAVSQESPSPTTLAPRSTSTPTVALTVAKNTPLQIALDQEVRVKKVG